MGPYCCCCLSNRDVDGNHNVDGLVSVDPVRLPNVQSVCPLWRDDLPKLCNTVMSKDSPTGTRVCEGSGGFHAGKNACGGNSDGIKEETPFTISTQE